MRGARRFVALLAGVAVAGSVATGPALLVRAAEPVGLRALPALYEDGKGTGLRTPESVAFDGAKRLAVADTGNGRVVLYDVAGEKITPGAEIRLPEIPSPLQARFAPDGGLLVLDGRLKKIARLTAAGQFKSYLVVQEEGARTPLVPRSFRVGADGAVFILDVAQGRVVVLGPDDRIRRQMAVPKDARGLSDLALDARGVVYALESVGRRVLVARPDDAAFAVFAAIEADVAFPTALSVDEFGRLAVADESGGGIVFLGPDGSFRGRQSSMGWKEGLLRSPSGLAAGPPGLLFVADRGNNRIAVFSVSK
ncbi:MAG TPA: NHL repeat-containing protein [Candidatus Polarisedimenticolia bacterium]|jgi:sugar lactone lactonase YvrE|nr:NHL repeat-containing protein [Candidatus Polarisedimenticolia bacterium]